MPLNFVNVETGTNHQVPIGKIRRIRQLGIRLSIARFREVISHIITAFGEFIQLTGLNQLANEISTVAVFQIPITVANTRRIAPVEYAYTVVVITKKVAGLTVGKTASSLEPPFS